MNQMNKLNQMEIEVLLEKEFIDQLHRPLNEDETLFINWMAEHINQEKT